MLVIIDDIIDIVVFDSMLLILTSISLLSFTFLWLSKFAFRCFRCCCFCFHCFSLLLVSVELLLSQLVKTCWDLLVRNCRMKNFYHKYIQHIFLVNFVDNLHQEQIKFVNYFYLVLKVFAVFLQSINTQTETNLQKNFQAQQFGTSRIYNA